uniref:START domain-containing protein n=1 Tax=Aplanochytrium stocchinoi TaxID=215587 RepID=A0A7S3PF00_9STRA|mmetsp:Transcript_18576/g.22723  ORF Transcript_18576/g.22723 Transcript_18576/m.22723 type:complete len:329 (-) Transcript_18576:409-1395(-)|eukprot:CAMPEP_0204821908 /NCGR_PEP_ID=MMETSP1346-20131115/111_1 /ASSEMBLY_ACC=CAM_ASM_000771 /TAXON_ID=215587 /ORGANISM="Aplanochytrium stocchinoi, Strain GSBS06" /LENGTH=328 /DNA_ID=CAMNT_0051947869 /DNA_START=12 /DNA_END=998 /DNA_ORIENTATION=+
MTTEIEVQEATLDKARISLIVAKENHAKATAEIEENANEYANEKYGKVKSVARESQMPSSQKWYNFWERASRIPKDEKYETCKGENMKYKTIVKRNKELVKSLAGETEGWSSVSNKGGIKIEVSGDRDVGAAKLYRATVKIPVSPRQLLVTQVRAPILGETDDSLVYMREHYNFVGGKTSLVHSVRKLAPIGSVSLRDYFDLTNWEEEEDGTIYYTSQSVKVDVGKLPGTVHGQNLLYGMIMKPAKVSSGGGFLSGSKEVDGTELTVFSQTNFNGWLPSAVVNWYAPSLLAAQIRSAENAAKAIIDDGSDSKMIRKYVDRELDDEEEQ